MKVQDRGISIPIPKQYSLTQRILCVPCIRCCGARQTELSSKERNRRRRIYASRDIPSNLKEEDEEKCSILELPTIELMKELYSLGMERQQLRDRVFESLKNKRLNPVEGAVVREDIEYYVPQIITYLAFQNDLSDEDLVEFIMRGCELHYEFSHTCFFYLNSISSVNNTPIPEIQSFLEDLFTPRMNIYKDAKLIGFELARCSSVPLDIVEPTQKEIQLADKYGTIEEDQITLQPVRNIKIKNYGDDGFMATPSFWFDLIQIGNDLSNINPKIIGLKNELRDINKKLPAAVYIPFCRNSLRNYTILNIDTDHARVFSTKQRSPYSIFIEVFRQEEEFLKVEPPSKMREESENPSKRYEKKKRQFLKNRISRPVTILKNENSLHLKHSVSMEEAGTKRWLRNRASLHSPDKIHVLPKNSYSIVDRQKSALSYLEGERSALLSQIEENARKQQLHSSTGQNQSKKYMNDDVKQMIEPSTQESTSVQVKDKFFDKPFKQIENQIKSKSIYKNFKTWKLINLMVKTGDNLKQQQFAMQLINQFDSIFKRQNIDLILRPYEVVSIGPDCGIIEMVTDTTSLARILKIMLAEGIPSLKKFWKYYFKSKEKQAQRNFMLSLVAYSLVTYFIQVKDRHNENILLHRDGYIVHIDFGFFLSNAPGKGIELEKNVPFKLMSSYVGVLGGVNSLLFLQFRSLFQKGFRACLKYKDQIITLVKMMYSSHGESMPCFIKGQTAVFELQQRFNPLNEDLTEHCQGLINQSLDNWRARWYDKFQYWLQGIFY